MDIWDDGPVAAAGAPEPTRSWEDRALNMCAKAGIPAIALAILAREIDRRYDQELHVVFQEKDFQTRADEMERTMQQMGTIIAHCARDTERIDPKYGHRLLGYERYLEDLKLQEQGGNEPSKSEHRDANWHVLSSLHDCQSHILNKLEQTVTNDQPAFNIGLWRTMQQLTPEICKQLTDITEAMLRRHGERFGNIFPPDASQSQMRETYLKIILLMQLHIDDTLSLDAMYQQFWEKNKEFGEENASFQQSCYNLWKYWRKDAVFEDTYFQLWVPVVKHEQFQSHIRTGMAPANWNDWKDSSSEPESPVQSPAESPAELVDETVEMGLQQLSLMGNEQPDGLNEMNLG